MMSGHNADQRWYWTGNKFDTDLAGRVGPAGRAEGECGARGRACRAARGARTARRSARPRRASFAVEGGGKPVGGGRLARAAGDEAAFRASPELDGDTLALAAGLVDEMQLGRGPTPDVLAISLSATDYVGHTFGTEGQEMCLQLLDLDREIGDFLALLDARGIDYAVALTADHGGKDIPERERLAGTADAVRVDAALRASRMGPSAGRQARPDRTGALRRPRSATCTSTAACRRRDRKRLLDAAVAAYRAHPAGRGRVHRSGSSPRLRFRPARRTAGRRASAPAQASTSPDRATCVVLLKRDVTPIPDTTPLRRHPWQRRGTMTGGCRSCSGARAWRRMAERRVVETIDIMPTLAAMARPSGRARFDRRPLPCGVAACPAGGARQSNGASANHLKIGAFLS